jgi:uncharacterized protein with beta-barrel porin domain
MATIPLYFVINGVAAATDLARINVGGKLNVSEHVSFTGSFDADLYRTPSYSGSIGVRVPW